MPSQNRRMDGHHSNRSSREMRSTGVRAELLENRLIAGAMAALTPGGLSLSKPDAATDLVDSALGVDSDRIGPASIQPTMQTFAPAADPLSEVGDPQPKSQTSAKSPKSAPPMMAAEGCGSGCYSADLRLYCYIEALPAGDNDSEAAAPELGLAPACDFRISVYPNSAFSDYPPQATINWTLGGDATPNVDYVGDELISGTTTIGLSGGRGSKIVSYQVKDDWTDESAAELISATLTGGDADGVAVQPWGNTLATGAVRSGDYTVKTFVETINNQGVQTFEEGDFVLIDLAPYQSGFYRDYRSVGVQALNNGVPQQGVEVELVLTNDEGVGRALIEDNSVNPRELVTSLTRTTGSDGAAYFKIIGAHAGDVTFTAYVTNREGRHQLKDIEVRMG